MVQELLDMVTSHTAYMFANLFVHELEELHSRKKYHNTADNYTNTLYLHSCIKTNKQG